MLAVRLVTVVTHIYCTVVRVRLVGEMKLHSSKALLSLFEIPLVSWCACHFQ